MIEMENRNEYLESKDNNWTVVTHRRVIKKARVATPDKASIKSQGTIKLAIPPRHHGKVIGAKGVNVQALSRKYGVAIIFPDRAAGTKTGRGRRDSLDVVFIRGKREENCLRVKEALLDLVPDETPVYVPPGFRHHGLMT